MAVMVIRVNNYKFKIMSNLEIQNQIILKLIKKYPDNKQLFGLYKSNYEMQLLNNKENE